MKILKTFLLVILTFLTANILKVNAESVTGSVTVTVTISQYKITVSPGFGCTATNSGVNTVNSGGTFSTSIDAITNYSIESVTADGRLLSSWSPTLTFPNVVSDHTISLSCKLLAVDNCGSGSGSTPQNPEPTGTSACAKGTLNSSSPVDTATAWNWSCGTVNTCSAPKYGCNVSADKNYNAKGPDNKYGCSNQCINGASDYDTCTPLVSGSLSANGCSIDAGGSSCQGSISWDVSNPLGQTTVTDTMGNTYSNGSDKGSNNSVLMSRGSKTFTLKNNGIYIARETANAECAGGSSRWVNSTCVGDPTDLTAGEPFMEFLMQDYLLPEKLYDRTPNTFFSIIKNSGDYATPVPFKNIFQVATSYDSNTNIATGIVDYLTDDNNFQVPANYSYWAQKSITFANAGTYYIRACADLDLSYTGRIKESDEDNNCSGWRKVVVSHKNFSDLVVSSVSPTVVKNNNDINFSATVKNEGDLDITQTFPSFFQVSRYPTGSSTDPTYFKYIYSDVLSGKSIEESQDIYIGRIPSYIRLCVDKYSIADVNSGYAGRIDESDENNNCGDWTKISEYSGPDAPTITGNINFPINTDQTFVITGKDSDGDNISYGIDWNNDSVVDYYSPTSLPYYASGYPMVTVPHKWSVLGPYSFKALTQDVGGLKSPWTTFSGTVTPPVTPASITSFSADKYSIDFGKAVVLTWTSTGATSCSITATATSVVTPNLPASSNKSFKPTKTTNYTLNCTGPGGSDSKTLPNPVVVGKINPSYQEY